jgi:hypothetical protein
VAERGAAGKTRQKVDRHGEDAEDQHFGSKPDLVSRKTEWQRHGGEQHASRDDERKVSR